MAERRRGREWSHPPWSPSPRNAHEGPWNGSYPAGYKLVRRVPHARKGLALDRKKLQTNEENICDLFDDVTDLGAPSSPAPLAHRFAAAGLDRARQRRKSRCGAVALGRTYLFPPLSSGGALVVQPWLPLRPDARVREPDVESPRLDSSAKTIASFVLHDRSSCLLSNSLPRLTALCRQSRKSRRNGSSRHHALGDLEQKGRSERVVELDAKASERRDHRHVRLDAILERNPLTTTKATADCLLISLVARQGSNLQPDRYERRDTSWFC
jgi:hypothetical protein